MADHLNRPDNTDLKTQWQIEQGTVELKDHRLRFTEDESIVIWKLPYKHARLTASIYCGDNDSVGRFILGYKDPDNFLHVDFVCRISDYQPFPAIRFYKRVGGEDTLIGESHGTDWGPDGWYTGESIMVCQDAYGRLTVQNRAYSDPLTEADWQGDYFGFGCGTSGAYLDIGVDPYPYYEAVVALRDDEPKCVPSCSPCHYICSDMPAEVVIEVHDITNNLGSNPVCDISHCQAINGTYVLQPGQLLRHSNYWIHACVYYAYIDPPFSCTDYQPGNPYNMFVLHTWSNTVIVEIGTYAQYGYTLFNTGANWTISTTCNALTDWASKTSGLGQGWYPMGSCGFSNSYIEIIGVS